MKELSFQTVIPGCTIQEFNQIALSDESAISNFHREVTKDNTVTVTPWSDGRREVEFILAMSIPKSVQSFIGAGPIRIRERQCVTWKGESSLEIISEPEVQISYAKSLVTKAELLVCGTSQGVTINVKVVVNASVPWPMQGTVESLMADQAKKTVGQYVEWIVKYVEAALEDMNNLRRAQEEVAAQASSEAVAMLPQLQQPQQQLEAQMLGPPTPPESTAAGAAAAAAAAVATPLPAAVTPVAATAAAVTSTALVPRPAAAAVPAAYAAAAAAAGEVDVFYDADEVVAGSALELLLRELREAKHGREQTHRLLESIRESLQHVDCALTRELAFQEGVRHAQLTAAAGASSSSSFSWFLSIAATAAAASAATTYLLMRRNALS